MMHYFICALLLLCISCQSPDPDLKEPMECCPSPSSPGCQETDSAIQDLQWELQEARLTLMAAETHLVDMIKEIQKLKVELGDQIDARIEQRLIQEHLIHPDLPHEGR